MTKTKYQFTEEEKEVGRKLGDYYLAHWDEEHEKYQRFIGQVRKFRKWWTEFIKIIPPKKRRIL